MRREYFRLATSLAFAIPGPAAAQGFQFKPFAQPELRAELTAGRSQAALVGAGVNVPAGYYVRVGPSVLVGRELSGAARTVGRVDLVGRFLTDPFHERRWNVYGGGGLGVVLKEGEVGRCVMLLVAGVDFPGRTGWRPSVEIGAGDGARVSLTFRPLRKQGR